MLSYDQDQVLEVVLKGVVFQELIEMIESKLGPVETQVLLDRIQLQSHAAYTSTGTYDHKEIIKIVMELSAKTQIEPRILVRAFGVHLYAVFAKKYPTFFENKDLFSFIKSIHEHIHVEVRKLYPDAELPHFDCQISLDQKELVLKYSSSRPFGDLAEGLLESSIAYFNEKAALQAEPVGDLPYDTNRLFRIRKEAA